MSDKLFSNAIQSRSQKKHHAVPPARPTRAMPTATYAASATATQSASARPHNRSNSPRSPQHAQPPLLRDGGGGGGKKACAGCCSGGAGGGPAGMGAVARQITMSPELFEKMYLSPQKQVTGDLRKRFANPTPLALLGFLICLSPLACQLMDWRETGGAGVGASGIGAYYFFGGVLLLIGSIGEWILGNTFPFVVFGSFSAFWLCFAATLTPSFNAFGAYATDPSMPSQGLATPAFLSSFGFFFLAMALLCTIYMVCSLRTNVAFFIIFLSLTVAFGLLTACYWKLARGDAVMARLLQRAAGASCFVTCAAGWWIFVAVMLESLDFPFSLPVGDLSWTFSSTHRKVDKIGEV